MLRDVLKDKPNVDVVKLQRSGGVVSRNAKVRQKTRSFRIRVNVTSDSFRNDGHFCAFSLESDHSKSTLFSFSRRNISMVLIMIFRRIQMSQVSATCVCTGLVVAHRPHVRLCQLVRSLLPILQGWFLSISTETCCT